MKIEPTLNGITFSEYGAKLLEYSVAAHDSTDGYFMPAMSYRPVAMSRDYQGRKISITCVFVGTDLQDTSELVSTFTAALYSGAVDIYLPDGFYYYCVMDSQDAPEIEAAFLHSVTYTLCGYRHGPLVTETLSSGTNAVTVTGNMDAECRYTIVATADSVTVGDITITDLTAGATVVVDGIDKLLTADDENVFANSDLVNFPKLSPGENSIVISGATSVTLEYYPVWF